MTSIQVYIIIYNLVRKVHFINKLFKTAQP